jgi:hypothetical protein
LPRRATRVNEAGDGEPPCEHVRALRLGCVPLTAGMTNTELPGPVKEFLLDHIDSIPELEALLLARTERGMHWLPATLAARLYVDVRTATAVLDALERRGLLMRGEAGFSYGPKTPELEAAVEALTDAHRRFLIPVTSIIHSKTRTALRDFADAFRLREEK